MSNNADRTETFTGNLKRCQTQLMRYIFALVRNVEDAQDVFQQTCVVLWEKFERFDPDSGGFCPGPARWHGSRRTTSSNGTAVTGPGSTKSSRHGWPSSPLTRPRPRLKPVNRPCRGASTSCRRRTELLMLCYGENQRVADVAARLGRPVSGVHNSLRLIRAKLMDCIERAVREGER